MTATVFRSGRGADVLVSAGVAMCGGFLLWCGLRLLPAAASAGGDLLPGQISSGPPPSSVLMLLAGFGAAAAGVVMTLWWIVGGLCALSGGLLHRIGFHTAGSRAMALAPGPLRRLSAAMLGLSLAAGSIPAQAAVTPPAGGPPVGVAVSQTAAAAAGPAEFLPEESANPADTSEGDGVTPLWRPVPPQPSGNNLLTATPRRDSGEVVVAAGDTLWSLAGQQLGPLASDAEIAARWPHWYELNRQTIGPDPGLIHPGQVLAVPPL